MSSWDSYIDNLMQHCAEQCDKACIIGQDGAKWTTDGHPKNFKLSAEECNAIAQCFKKQDFTPLQANGVRAENVKYQFLRADDKVVMAKKKDCGAITLQASKTAIVIGHTKEGGQQGCTNKGVGVIADYLESLNM